MSENEGCWVAYGLDYSLHMSTTVFADELEARRYAMSNHLTVGFLRWGESLSAALRRVGTRPTTSVHPDGTDRPSQTTTRRKRGIDGE